MTRFFDATFEGASLTGASGASSVTGTVTLDNTSKIIGTYSSKHDTASSFLRFDFSSSTTIYVSALLYVTTFSANIRTIYITNVARIDIRSNGALRLSDGSGTQIGSDSSILSTNTLYHIGLRYTAGSGSDAIIEGFVTAGVGGFGAPFASTNTAVYTLGQSRVDCGNTSGASANTFYLDNIRIDSAAMPSEYVDTAFTASASLTNTTEARISQLPVEVVLSGTPAARVSQVATEVVLSGTPAARISQVVVEVVVKAGLINVPFMASASFSIPTNTTFTTCAAIQLYNVAAAQSIVFPIESTQTHYELRLVHQTGDFYIDVLDRVLAFDYTLVINDVSVCNLTLLGDYPISYLTKDNRIEIWRGVGNGPMALEGDTQFLIQTVVREVDANGAKIIKVTAYSLNHLLTRRVVAYDSDDLGYGYMIEHADRMMQQVVHKNLGGGALDMSRQLLAAGFDVQVTTNTGPSIEMDVSWKIVLDVLKDIANASFTNGTPLFFEVVSTNPPKNMEFQIYLNHRGVDRRASSGNPLVLSQANGAIGAYSITEDWSTEVNYVYGFGPGEGDKQMFSPQYDSARMNATVFARKEYVLSNQDADTVAALDASSQAILAQNRPRKLFNGTVLNTPIAMYGRDWKLGYWLTAEDESDAFDCFVAAVQVSVDGSKEDVQATLRNDFSWT